MKEEQEVKDEDIRTSSLLILGSESPVIKRLFGQVSKPEAGFYLVVRLNPLNINRVVAYADSDSKQEIDPVARKLIPLRKIFTSEIQRRKKCRERNGKFG